MSKHQPVRLTNKKTGHVALAILPREVVQLKAAGYVEDKPAKKATAPKPAESKSDDKS